MTNSYFYIWRSIQDNPLWKEKPFSRAQAWIDLIMMAQYSDGDIHLSKGFVIEAKRGDVFYGLKFFMKRWGWGKGKVIRFKEYLLTQRMANDVSNQREVRHERTSPRTPTETPETSTGPEVDEKGKTEADPKRTPGADPKFNVLSIENYSYYQGEAIKERTPGADPPNKVFKVSKDTLGEKDALSPRESKVKPSPKRKRKTKETNPDVRTFIQEWGKTYSEKFNEAYTHEWGKEGRLVREMLDLHGVEKLRELREEFFSSQDSFIKETGYTIGVFKKQLNKLNAARKGSEPMRDYIGNPLEEVN